MPTPLPGLLPCLLLAAPVLQGLAGPFDFSLLPLVAWVPALVVASHKKDDARPMEVHKDPEKDRLPRAHPNLLATEHLLDFVFVMANPKLMKTVTKRFQPFRSGQVEASLRKDQADGGVESNEFGFGQSVQPRSEGLLPIRVLVNLDSPKTSLAGHQLILTHRCSAEMEVRGKLSSHSGLGTTPRRNPPVLSAKPESTQSRFGVGHWPQ